MYKVEFGHRVMEQREGEWYPIKTHETYSVTEPCETEREVLNMFEAYIEYEFDNLMRNGDSPKGIRKFGRGMNFHSNLTAYKNGKKHNVYFEVSRA